MFSKSKLNSIKNLVSQALIDMEKGHEESIKILKKKGKYEMKENLRHVNENLEERTEKTRLNGVNSRTWKSIFCFCIYKMCLLSAEGYENARV